MLIKLILSALAASFLWAAHRPVQAESVIDKSSYEVATIVHHFDEDANRVEIHVEEKYSHEQARGLVKIRVDGKPASTSHGWFDEADGNTDKSLAYDGATFYASPLDGTSLVMNESGCRESEDNELLKLLHLDYSSLQLDKQYDHVIGPMRWVHYLSAHRAELVRDPGTSKVRDVTSIRYGTQVSDSAGDMVDVRVFFEEAALLSNQQLQPLPLSVAFRRKNMLTIIRVFSSKFRLSNGDSLGQNPRISDEPELDMFMVMPVTGCSALLSASNRKSLFEERKLRYDNKNQFSFRAHATRTTSTSRDHLDLTVAFDIDLRILRVDMESPGYAVTRSMSLFNYHRNRAYHVLKDPRRDGHALINHVLNLPNSPPEVDEEDATSEGGPAQVDDIRRKGSKCVSSKISILQDTLAPSNLWGAREFAYLGRARVRGIRAKVYESIDSEVPRWLESPINYGYNNSAGVLFKTRLASNLNSPAADERLKASKLTSLVYLSDEKSDHDAQRVLHMEIYRVSADYQVIYEKHSIQFHDFSWSLTSFSSHNSNQVAGLFSLAEFCAEESGEEVRLELQLEQTQFMNKSMEPTGQELSLLRLPRFRNWATLKALHDDLHLSVEMLTDFQTRLIEPSQRQTGWLPRRLLASFNLAKRQTQRSSFSFVGRGNKMSRRTWTFKVPNFYQCAMLAEHRKMETHFAWNPETSECHLGIAAPNDENAYTAFYLSETGPLEIYRTSLEEDLDSAVQLHSSDVIQFQLRGNTFLFYMTRELATGMEANPIPMTLKHVNLHRSQTEPKKVKHVEVIKGFALEPQESVAPATVEVDNLADCRSICHNDLDCRAFSFCMRGTSTECLISQIDFSAPLFSERLHKWKYRKIVIEEGTSEFRFRRAPTCSIYNRRFLSQFKKQPDNAAKIRLQNIMVAESAEDCARHCFATNLQGSWAQRDYLDKALKALKGVIESSETDLIPSRLEALGKIANSSRLMSSATCTGFRFLERILVESLPGTDHQALIDLAGPSASGYCDLHSPVQAETSEKSLQLDSVMSPDRYEIRYSDLYEEEFGVNLLGSELTEEEITANGLASLTLERALPNMVVDRTEVLLDLIEKGKNIQESENGGKEICAEMCFKQTSGLWPACKSFDVVRVVEFGWLRSKCVFNTITKQEAIAKGRTELIDTSMHDYQRWHYEPKVKVQDSLLMVEEADSLLRLFLRQAGIFRGPSFWSHLSVFLIAILGIVSGLVLGVMGSLHLQRRREAERRFSQGSVAPVLDNDLEMNNQ